jgi:hypothetical protein
VTLARAATDTFSGIRPGDVLRFITAQLFGAAAATALFSWLVPSLPALAPNVVLPHAIDDIKATMYVIQVGLAPGGGPPSCAPWPTLPGVSSPKSHGLLLLTVVASSVGIHCVSCSL